MCGIAGIISFRSAVEPAALEAANALMAYRGPDDAGVWLSADRRVGFAQRRLSIIDLSPAGHQPMVWRDGSSVVVINFNGEIYNFRELRAECDVAALRQRGEPIAWRGHSDTEVVLWAYLLWGADLFPMLDGMFALAIWDGRSREMVVARDRFGVKPCYITTTAQHFAFASELKALGALVTLDRQVDALAAAQYIGFLYTPGERTLLTSVRKLPPGELMVIGLDGVNSRRRFVTAPMTRAADLTMPADEAVAGVRRLLEQAVQQQLIADVPVGAFLSGGIDSSALVALARRQMKHGKMQCFTIGHRQASTSDEGLASDLPYAEKVARHLDVDLHTVWVGPEMAAQFPWMIAQLDEPQADPAALNAYFICKLAREQGIKVLLSGAGGDDLFSGYRRHRALGLEHWWSWLPVAARRGLAAAAQAAPANRAWGRRLAKAFRHADATETERLVNYFLWLDPHEIGALWQPDFAAAAGLQRPAQPMFEALESMAPAAEPLARMLMLDSRFFLVDHNLNYTDKMSMAASVEVRVPFLDNALVDFAARIPGRHKQRGPVGKWVLKEAMRGVLPDEVLFRPKSGFGVPLRAWMRHEMRDLLEDALSPTTLRRRGMFAPAAVARLRERDRRGQIDATYPILALVCIELWCRNFVDQRS